MKLDPREDGITHVNIYSQGKTRLGRLLSNWADCNIETKQGRFRTLEGFIFYLLSGEKEKCFQSMTGFEAKSFGEGLTLLPLSEEFKSSLGEAMRLKVKNLPELKDELRRSNLPFAHYYVYAGKVVSPKGWAWQTKLWEVIRSEIKNDQL